MVQVTPPSDFRLTGDITESKMNEAIQDNRIWFGSNYRLGLSRMKKFITEGQQGLTIETLIQQLPKKEVGTNELLKGN